jgi:arylsulfatase A
MRGFIGMVLLLLFSVRIMALDKSPNVVLIYADDMGYGDLGCYGATGYATPHLDRLASEGTRFTNFHVAQAVCSASRAALLTGCYPNRIGIGGALMPDSKIGLQQGELTIAEMLKARGYSTAIFGKWHLGHHPQFLPTRHGFDQYFGLPYSNDMWPNHPTMKFPDLPLIEGERTIELNPDQTQLTTWYTERAVRFIEEHQTRPFFLYVAHSMPHVPLFVSAKFRGKTSRGIYGDVISEIDWSVGEILSTLIRLRLEKNTLVIFASDNGPWLSYGEHAGSAGPLREGKGTSWEGGIRVPCLMRWPGKIPAGRTSNALLMTIDILPTLARICGGRLPSHKIDGMDVWPLLAGKKGAQNPHAAYFVYYNQNDLQAVLSGRWKLMLPHGSTTLGGNRLGKEGQPVAYRKVQVEFGLYDLENDIGETRDIATDHPEVVARLLNLAEQMRDDLGDDLTGHPAHNQRPAGHLPD